MIFFLINSLNDVSLEKPKDSCPVCITVCQFVFRAYSSVFEF